MISPWEMVFYVGVWLCDHPPWRNRTATIFHHAAVNSNGLCTFLSLQHLSGVNSSSSSEAIQCLGVLEVVFFFIKLLLALVVTSC